MKFVDKKYIHIIFIIVVAIACYSNSFDAPFTYDSKRDIPENPSIRNLDNYLSISAFKSSRFFGYFLFAIDYKIAGLSVFQYHLTNLIIHIINGIIVYFIIIMTAKAHFYQYTNSVSDENLSTSWYENRIKPLALFCALIFISHPIQTQAVTYIVQRNTSLATTFYILSLLMFVNGRSLIVQLQNNQHTYGEQESNKGSRKRMNVLVGTYFLLSLIFGYFATRTKEISATLPLTIFLYELFFFKVSLKKIMLFLLPLLLILLILPSIVLYGTDHALKETISYVLNLKVMTDIPRDAFIFTQFRVMVLYIRLIFLPINQCLDYHYPVYESFYELPVILSFLFLLSLLILAIYLLKVGNKNNSLLEKIISYGIVWFFVTHLPYTVIPIIDLVIEHRLYLPMVGVSMALAFGFNMIFDLIQKRWQISNKSKITVAVLIIIALGVTTFMRNNVWRSDVSLWEDVVSKHPEKVRGHINLVNAYMEAGKYREGIKHSLEFLEVAPPNFKQEFYNFIGYGLFKLGRYEDAKVALEQAIHHDKNFFKAYSNLATVYIQLKDYKRALELLQRSVEIGPNAAIYNNLGVVYINLNMIDEAIAAFKKSLELDPLNKETELNLQTALKNKK